MVVNGILFGVKTPEGIKNIYKYGIGNAVENEDGDIFMLGRLDSLVVYALV